MLERTFLDIYIRFRLHFYRQMFALSQNGKERMSVGEVYCVEMISYLGNPSVSEFAAFAQISPSNAAYKVSCLVKKGYIEKMQSPTDKREFRLRVTDRYMDYYNINTTYAISMMDRVRAKFSDEDIKLFEDMLETMVDYSIPLGIDGDERDENDGDDGDASESRASNG